jgi:hypothetical protein
MKNMAVEMNSLDISVERYLSGEMPEAEHAAFREQLANNPEAAALIGADRLISKVAGTAAFVELPSIVPSDTLVRYLANTRPHRTWAAYIAAGSFIILLGMILFMQGSYSEPNSVPHQAIVQPLTAAPVDSMTQAVPLPSAAMKDMPHAVASSQHGSAVAGTRPAYHDLDEHLGKPRIYAKDTVSFKVKTK